MATTGLVNLAESLLNQTTAQGLRAVPATNGTATAAAGPVNTGVILDEFVPSSPTGDGNATAEAAGLFTASPSTLFTAAAHSLLAQPASSQTNIAAAPATTLPTAAIVLPTDANAISANGNVTPLETVPLQSAGPATAIASIQAQLQTLNNLLAPLGLSTTDVQKVDQIASLINDFNPSAYSSLVYQLEGLARNAARQTAQTSTANGNAVS